MGGKYIKKSITPDASRKNYFYVGEIYPKDTIYKYQSLDTALICLEKGNIRFVQPSQWPDKYEALFYNACYDRLGVNEDFHPKLFACCFTTRKMSEAAWKVYSYNKNGLAYRCVKFGIDLEKLRNSLACYADRKELKVYECMMNYTLDDDEIKTLHKKKSPYYSELFDNFDLSSYLSLLTIKRKAFSYESELRFYLVSNDNQNRLNDYEDVDLPYSDLIKNVAIDGECTDIEKDILGSYCQRNNVDLSVKREKLYYCPNDNLIIEGDHEVRDKILEFIKNYPMSTVKDMKKNLGVTQTTLSRRLQQYINEGVVASQREGKSCRWYTTD